MTHYFGNNEGRSLHVSALAAVEVRSAIRRRQFEGDLDADTANLILTRLKQETEMLNEHSVTDAVIAEAINLIDRHRLRALDTLQLASAIICRSAVAPGDVLHFVSGDVRLLGAAASEGFDVWDPNSPT